MTVIGSCPKLKSLSIFYELTHFFRLNEEHFTFLLQYKNFATVANRNYPELSYPQESENVRPHSSNSIENATPSIIVNPICDPMQRHIPISL